MHGVLIRLNMVFFHSLIHIRHLSVTEKSMHALSTNKLLKNSMLRNMVFFHSLIHIGHLSVTDKSMHTLSTNKLLKAPITTAADDKFCDIFPNFRQK